MSSRTQRVRVKRMSDGAAEKLNAAAHEAVWRATCKVCKAELTGTMAALAAHAKEHEDAT